MQRQLDYGLLLTREYTAWSRLYSRYKLEPWPVQTLPPPNMLPTIQPVTNFDQLLRTPYNKTATADISAGAGTYVAMLTVPAGKRWWLFAWWRENTSANSTVILNVAGVELPVSSLGTSATISGNVYYVLDEGDSIGLDSTGNGGDSSRRLIAHYEQESAY